MWWEIFNRYFLGFHFSTFTRNIDRFNSLSSDFPWFFFILSAFLLFHLMRESRDVILLYSIRFHFAELFSILFRSNNVCWSLATYDAYTTLNRVPFSYSELTHTYRRSPWPIINILRTPMVQVGSVVCLLIFLLASSLIR